jgi:hypothetical protein
LNPAQNIQTPNATPQPVVATPAYTFEQYQAGMPPPVANAVPPPAQNLQVPPVTPQPVAQPLATGGPLPGAEADEVLTPWKVLFWSIEEPILPEYVESAPTPTPTPAPVVEPVTPTPAV